MLSAQCAAHAGHGSAHGPAACGSDEACHWNGTACEVNPLVALPAEARDVTKYAQVVEACRNGDACKDSSHPLAFGCYMEAGTCSVRPDYATIALSISAFYLTAQCSAVDAGHHNSSLREKAHACNVNPHCFHMEGSCKLNLGGGAEIPAEQLIAGTNALLMNAYRCEAITDRAMCLG